MPKEKKGSWPPSELEEKVLEFTKSRYEQVPGLSDFNYGRLQQSLDRLHDHVPVGEVEELLAPIADAIRELSEQSHIDALTNLPNRRALMNHLRREFFSARRAPRHPLACMLADIDHFKKINDTYGHPVGDACLRLLGHIFCEHEYLPSKKCAMGLVRGSDYVCRYGGEEFSILLSKVSSRDSAYQVAERIRRTLEVRMRSKTWLQKAFNQLNIHLPGIKRTGKTDAASLGRSPVYFGEEEVQATKLQLHLDTFPSYTISIGVCFYNPHEHPPHVSCHALLAAADAALYQSKREGRNRITMWEGPLEGLVHHRKK